MCSEKLFCVVTLLFETRVGTVNPSAVVRGLKRALRSSAPNLPDDLQICRVGLLGLEWSDFAQWCVPCTAFSCAPQSPRPSFVEEACLYPANTFFVHATNVMIIISIFPGT